MSFGFPGALLGLLLVPLFVTLYLRRAGRRETLVPDLTLWREVAAVSQAEAGKKVGSLDWLLVFAVLFLTAAILAAAQPVLHLPTDRTPAVLVVADRSASMRARAPDGGTRWDRAAGAAAEVLDGLTGEVLLLGVPAIAGPPLAEMDGPRAAALLRRMAPTELPIDLAAEFARSAGIARRRAAAVLVVTDRPGAVPPRVGDVPVFVFSAGGELTNAAVDAFEITADDDDTLRPFVAVRNYGAQPIEGRLELIADGAEVFRQPLSLAGEERLAFTGLPALDRAETVEARLVVDDDLALDNRAYAAAPGTGRIRVALVGRENPFVSRALRLLPEVDLSQFPRADDVEAGFDLVVYNEVTPARLPEGDAVLIGPEPNTTVGPIQIGDAAEHSPPAGAVRVSDSPLLENVDLGPLRFARLPEITAPAEARTVLEPADGAGTILLTWEDPQRRVTVVGCRLVLSDTNWPMTASFPIFWSNVIDPVGGEGDVPVWFPIGEYIAVRRPPSGALSVVGPEGEPVDIVAGRGGRDYFLPTKTGVYTVEAEGRRALYAVNLLDPGESGAAGAESRPSHSDIEAALAPEADVGVPLWRYFAAAALILGFVCWGLIGRNVQR